MMQPVTGAQLTPSEETIRLGPLTVRFLITGKDSSGSIAAFELTVPGSQRLAAPAHSHDHYEETIYGMAGVLTWTVDGKQIAVGEGQVREDLPLIALRKIGARRRGRQEEPELSGRKVLRHGLAIAFIPVRLSLD